MNEITLEQAEERAMQTDYAVFANEDTERINKADAGAFYMEGYNAAIREQSSDLTKLREALTETAYELEKVFMDYFPYDDQDEIIRIGAIVDNAKQLLTKTDK